MKIIIFGATGSIGSDLVDYFSKDHNIIAVYRNKKNILSKPNKNIKWIKLNLLKKIKLKIKADVIINCIVVHSFSNKNNYIDYINSNVISLKNILLFANAIRVKSFFNLSSIKTYGDSKLIATIFGLILMILSKNNFSSFSVGKLNKFES